MQFPDFIRHYYIKDRGPFLNIMDLSLEERKKVAAEFNKMEEEGLMHRSLPDWYLIQRENADKKLRELSKAEGLELKRKSPHFFSLGVSYGFEWAYKGNCLYIDIPIEKVKSKLLFSIGDTFWLFAESLHPEGFKLKKRWYQNKLYTYEDVINILTEVGIDISNESAYKDHGVFIVETFIWDDEVLKEALKFGEKGELKVKV